MMPFDISWPSARSAIPHGVSGGQRATRRRALPARQPDVVLHLAQHHPACAPVAHCVAPDLIGFGQSGKPDIAYRFADHVRYLDDFIAANGIASAYLVAQDWGTALAFHLAARRPEFVRGLAFMEFIRPVPSWDDFHQVSAARETFRRFRTPGEGEKMILEGNAFVERVLPGSIRRKFERRRDGCLSRAVSDAAIAPSHLALAERAADRRRAAVDVYAAFEARIGARGLAVPSCVRGVPVRCLAGFRRKLRSWPMIASSSTRRQRAHYVQKDHRRDECAGRSQAVRATDHDLPARCGSFVDRQCAAGRRRRLDQQT